MNGRFHQRQCNRAEPSSRMISKTDLLPPRKRLRPSATIFPRAVNGFVLGEFGNFSEMPAVFVTPGPVQQQIFNRENSQPRQLRRAFRADAPKRSDGIFQRRNFIFRRRHRPHDTNRLRRLQLETGSAAAPGWQFGARLAPNACARRRSKFKNNFRARGPTTRASLAARGARALPRQISRAPDSSAFWSLLILRRHERQNAKSKPSNEQT